MKKTLYFLFAALVLTQCRPDVIEDFVPFGSQESAILGLLKQASDPTAETIATLAFPTDDTVKVVSQKGTLVSIVNPDLALVDASTGQTVACRSCQELKIIVKEVISERQMVANGITLYSTSMEVARTSGAIFVEVLCNGKKLEVSTDAFVEVEVLDTNPANKMLLHTGVLNQNQLLTDWVNSPGDTVYLFDRPSTIPLEKGYEFRIKKMGWNVGFLPLQAPTTSFCLNMDRKYNSENTFAYLLLNDERASIRMPFDAQSGQFCLDGVPQGADVQIMVVSKIGDQWHSVLQSTNTSVGQLPLDPKQTTDAEVVETVKGL